MELLVQPDGVVRCVYGETIDLSVLGPVCIRRGSHVEPDTDGRWFAGMAPVQGPRLGPFARRSEALDAERQWLKIHWLIGRVYDDRIVGRRSPQTKYPCGS